MARRLAACYCPALPSESTIPDVLPPPRLSLVIPAYNESAFLPRLLDSVMVARSRYTRGPDAIEIIVADNHSTDDTAAIAERYGCRVARVAQAGA